MKRFLLCLLVPALLFTSCGDDTENSNDDSTSARTYETVEGDRMGTKIYTLENGLKVYLSVNKDEPRIQTNIAVRAGSKQDPADATGLAHYLEHMLFKGTSEFGTSDWEAEKVLLEQISDLYEKRRNTTDEAERLAIYQQIDSLSYEAAKIAIPNEYDKMISSIGARGTNAYTSNEQTVYVNDIPSNELEKWMSVESLRFRELVLRLFHTELETVYEEFNRGQDNDGRKAWQAMTSALYKNHPYGTQTTIGTGEHLKNPSMEKIHEYFDTYYVPNNMAIVLAGDLDPDETIELIEKYFGDWERKDIPKFTFEPEEPLSGVDEHDVYGPNAAWTQIAFRAGGVNTDDAKYFTLIDGLLNNGSAGLIDLNLVQEQKILRGGCYFSQMADYSQFVLSGTPRQGQSLAEVKDLLLGQVELIKQGQFDDWLLDAVRKDLKKSEIASSEYNGVRVRVMTNAFVQGLEWSEVVNELKELESVTKDDLVKFANERLGDDYVWVRKNTGSDDQLHKVEKPSITQLDIERDEKSSFFKEFEAMESPRVEPLFLDYKSAITTDELNNSIPFSYIENKTNELFTLRYILDIGGNHDNKLPIAINYLEYLGTSRLSASETKKEFFKLGLDYSVFSGADRCYITLSGLNESFEEGVKLFEELLADVQPNQTALDNMIEGMLKERADAKLNKFNIMYGGMRNFAMYGEDNPSLTRLSEAELRAITPEELIERIQNLTSYEHQVFYYGSEAPDAIVASLNDLHETPATKLMTPEEKIYVQQETNTNKVYFVDFDMVQTEIMMLSKGQQMNLEVMPARSLFNEYFGSGLSSIVFQEIREAKALAYSAYCSYTAPGKPDEAHYVQAYLGVQADKLQDAVGAMLDLMDDMPRADIQFEGARDAAMKKIETERITKSSIFWSYQTALRRGIDYDLREKIYADLQDMTFDDLQAFFDENVKGKSYTFLVIGKKENVDAEVLKQLGEYQELQLSDLFRD